MKLYTLIILSAVLVSCSNNTSTEAADAHDTLTGPAPLKLEKLDTSAYSDYQKNIIEYRLQKDRAYKTGEKSPIEADKRGVFTGLNYFEPDTQYRVLTKVTILKPEPVEFKTTTERVAHYNKYAELEFAIRDRVLKLYAYVDAEEPESGLFIPFNDSTTGKSTYGGGRFIEMPVPEKDMPLILDFNKAFNPYCHYNHNYSCPAVPKENTLDIAIEAGEKILYEH